MSTELKTLYAKMAAVMGALDRVPKSGHNKQQNYDYATESDISDAIRRELAKNKIAFIPRMINVVQTEITSKGGNPGYHTMIDFEFTFACGDTGATITTAWRGEADDYGDKSVSKTSTLAQKYFLLRTFVMSTGDPKDDPDSDIGYQETTDRNAVNWHKSAEQWLSSVGLTVADACAAFKIKHLRAIDLDTNDQREDFKRTMMAYKAALNAEGSQDAPEAPQNDDHAKDAPPQAHASDRPANGQKSQQSTVKCSNCGIDDATGDPDSPYPAMCAKCADKTANKDANTKGG